MKVWLKLYPKLWGFSATGGHILNSKVEFVGKVLDSKIFNQKYEYVPVKKIRTLLLHVYVILILVNIYIYIYIYICYDMYRISE